MQVFETSQHMFVLLYLFVHWHSISKDSEEMSNFIDIFTQEHGQAPAFNLFESCEQVAKRSVSRRSF